MGVTLAVYANALSAPFQVDDIALVLSNPLIKDLRNFLHLSDFASEAHYGIVRRRVVSFFSLALNYAVGGASPVGFQVVGKSLHVANVLLLYFLLRRIFRTPRFRELDPSSALRISILTALLFSVHPLMTESNNYIMARFGALASLFYLAVLLLHVSANERPGWRGTLLRVGSVTAAILAYHSKEMTVTLPVVLVLCERWLFGKSWRSSALSAVPAALAGFTLLHSYASTGLTPGALLGWVNPAEDQPLGFDRHFIGSCYPRHHYLLTQVGVVAQYLRLAVFPFGLNFWHDVPLQTSPLSWSVVLPGAALLVLFLAARFVARRAHQTQQPLLELPLAGLVWFAVTLAVESTVLPIPMLMCEYRAYLPAAGVLLAVVATAEALIGRTGRGPPRAYWPLALVFVVGLGTVTVLRNVDWSSRLALSQDTVRKSPGVLKAHVMLGSALLDLNRYDDAIAAFSRARAIDPADRHDEYARGLQAFARGKLVEATALLRSATEGGSLSEYRVRALSLLGKLLEIQGDLPGACRAHRAAVAASRIDFDTTFAPASMAALRTLGCPEPW